MTYSIGATGRPVDALFAVSSVTVGDDAGRLGSQQAAMRNGSQILCKNLDGSQSYYMLDAELSTPSSVVLKRV